MARCRCYTLVCVNYYPFHIGDYAAHTAHLEPMEDLAYRRLLDLYYMREDPLPADIQATAKLIRMRSMAADVGSVLREFFELCDEGWRHRRCDIEIVAMREKQQKQRDKANKRWHKPGAEPGNASAMPQHAKTDAAACATDAVAMPPTPTPTPTPKIKKNPPSPSAKPPPCPDGVDHGVWADWLALRNAKKAPVTPTVIGEASRGAGETGMSLEAFLRVWCARGSQGLEADWLRPHERPPPAAKEPEWRREQRERTAAFAGHAAAKVVPITVESEHVAARLG